MTALVEIKDLTLGFNTELGHTRVLDGVWLTLNTGEITALVGESGSGKSVTANSIMRLLPKNADLGGEILFHAQEKGKEAGNKTETINIVALSENEPALRQFRGDRVSMVFQEPMTALSPVHTIGDQISEAILCHQADEKRGGHIGRSAISKDEAFGRSVAMLAAVGLPDPESAMLAYPFQFSGGMRQRAVIAMALVCEPELLICDEPTTALDVTVQADILVLLRRLQSELNNALLFITHDLAVVAQIADRVAVMLDGKIVEEGAVRDILRRPEHPYTQKLINAVPRL